MLPALFFATLTAAIARQRESDAGYQALNWLKMTDADLASDFVRMMHFFDHPIVAELDQALESGELTLDRFFTSELGQRAMNTYVGHLTFGGPLDLDHWNPPVEAIIAVRHQPKPWAVYDPIPPGTPILIFRTWGKSGALGFEPVTVSGEIDSGWGEVRLPAWKLAFNRTD